MSAFTSLADSSDRLRAAMSFDQNVVVTAGAGTGKTTLLVDRLIHLLMRNPEPLKITEIVALTFTHKAADEMKLRLRERLQSYLDARMDRPGVDHGDEAVQSEIKSLIERYQLSKNGIDGRAKTALGQIERSEIGTIHSFAATLLRLYPMEAGLDPQFQEDDGSRFERYFEESWSVWLEQELSGRGDQREEWKKVLRKIPLGKIGELAFALCSESVELASLFRAAPNAKPPLPIEDWLKKLADKAKALMGQHSGGKLQIDRLIGIGAGILSDFVSCGELAGTVTEEEKALLVEKRPSRPQSWGQGDFEQAEELIRIARHLCRVDEELVSSLCSLLLPFVSDCREGFIKAGFVSFDGLLVRARNLVRDHGPVREELKRQYKAILIDEFQDTDPTQYEILLYLAERLDRRAGDWRKVSLTPGKIFVVGDPKQSIYSFRRADIEAYLEVVQNVIKKQKGVEYDLTTNFRSHGEILNFVNTSFEKLIRPVPGLQPSYVAVQPAGEDGGDGSHGNASFPFRKVAIRRVVPEEGEINAEIARQLEAESLARWLAEEVLDRVEILDREGRPVVVRAKDVAILLRKLTDLHHYLEPLRRRGIRYVVEGERHFYAAQEIVDAVNLLRAVENPYDRAALVGLLRSPIGGLKDAEIYQLHRRGLLDYRRLNRLDQGVDAELVKRVRELFGMLHKLHEEIRQLPVGEAVVRVFAALPIEVLAARSFHGEQAIANLEKIRRQAETLGREGSGTLKEVISLLQRRVLELKEEAEGALTEETVDAVRILSVHKSKGLEFPVVILAGCQLGTRNADGTKVKVYPDWSTQLVGLRINELSNLSGVFLEEKAKLREDEEQKRVLYVAATRAREHLSISCAGTRTGGSGNFASMLERAIGDFTSFLEPKVVLVGSREIEVNVVTERLGPPDHVLTDKGNESPAVDWSRYRNFWKRRDEIYRESLRRPLFVTPSSLKKREEELAEEYPDKEYRVPSVAKSILIGNLAHRFLQDWDFSMKRRGVRDGVDSFLGDFIKGLPEPVPDSIQMELAEIFQIFFMSSVYEELRTSEILGREVPLMMPWDGQVMEGVIDVIYEKEGHLYVADYKTDRIERKELPGVAKSYRYQADIYSEAVRRALRRDVSEFKLIFLRLGEALQV